MSVRALRFNLLNRAAISIVLLLALLAAGCGSDDAPRNESSESRSPTQSGNDPGPVHVHGLGVNPKDDSVFIATHTGLFRAEAGKLKASRVAGRFQDTMGFTVVGSDTFLGSGHPDLREDQPPFLGLIRSTDAGRAWKSISLKGQADFHVLEASGQRVYGYGSDFDTRRQQLLVSDNGGRTWRNAKLPERSSGNTAEESLLSLAIDPNDDAHIVASGPQALWQSSDAGRNWTLLSNDPGYLAWPEPLKLYRLDNGGSVSVSIDGGERWDSLGNVAGQPSAFDASEGLLLAALHDGTIKQSRTGDSWDVRSQP